MIHMSQNKATIKKILFVFPVLILHLILFASAQIFNLENSYLLVPQNSHTYNLRDPYFYNLYSPEWCLIAGENTWLQNKEGKITLPPKITQCDYKLKLVFTALDRKEVEEELTITFNEKEITKHKIHPKFNTVECTIPFRDFVKDKSQNELSFETNFKYRPKDVIKGSEDKRTLSICIHSLELVPSQPLWSAPALNSKIFIYPDHKLSFRTFAGIDDAILMDSASKKKVHITIANKNDFSEAEVTLDGNTTFKIPEKFHNKALSITLHIDDLKNPIELVSLQYKYTANQEKNSPSTSTMFFPYYYPWYFPVTQAQYVTHPLFAPYDFSKSQFSWEVSMAKKYGIDGFCVTYYGKQGDQRYSAIMEESDLQDFKIIYFVDSLSIYHRECSEIYYRYLENNKTPIAVNYDTLAPYIKNTLYAFYDFEHLSYTFLDGKPVVYIYALGVTWDISEENLPLLSRVFRFLFGANSYLAVDLGSTPYEKSAISAKWFDALTYYTPINRDRLINDPNYSCADMEKLNDHLLNKLGKLSENKQPTFPVVINGYDDHLVHPDWHQPGISPQALSKYI